MLFGAISSYFANGKSVFNEGLALVDMNILEALLTFLTAISSCFLFFFVSFRLLKAKPRLYVTLPFCIFFILGLVAIFAYPSSKELNLKSGSYLFSLSFEDKAISAMQFTCLCLVLFSLIEVAPKVSDFKSIMVVFCWGAILISLIAIIYSFFKEGQNYLKLFNSLFKGDEYGLCISSFLLHPNTFGVTLLIGISSCIYLNSYKPRFLYSIIIGLFYFISLFTLCRTVVLISTPLILIYYLYRFIKTLKDNPKRNWVAFGITSAILLTVTLIGLLPLFGSKSLFFRYFNIKGDSLNRDSFLSGRFPIWGSCLMGIDKWNLVLLGEGYRNETLIMRFVTFSDLGYSCQAVDGGFVDLYLRFGINGIIALSLLCFYFGWRVVKNIKSGSRMTFTCLLLSLAFFAHGVTECTGFIGIDIESLCFLMLSFYPVFSETEKKKCEYIPPIDKNDYKPISTLKSVNIILLPIVSCLLSVSYDASSHYKIGYLSNCNFIVTLLFLFLTLPIVIYFVATNNLKADEMTSLKEALKATFPYWLSLGLTNLTIHGFSDFLVSNYGSQYSVIVICLLSMLLNFCFLLPFGKSSFKPIRSIYSNFEDRYEKNLLACLLKNR